MLKNLSKTFLFAGLFTLQIACTAPKAPSFKQLKNLEMRLKDPNTINLIGYAVYNNPNPIGATLSRTELQILIENTLVSTINQSESIDVPASSEFEIPIDIGFDLDLLNKANRNLLNQAIKQILANKLEVQYKGKVYFKILGKEIGVPVDYKEKISIGFNYQESN